MGSDAALSPDGKQLAFVFRGEIFVTSTDYATTKQITHTAASEADVCFSPDGRKLAYASERDGKWQIFTAELSRKEDVNFAYATTVVEKPVFKDNKLDRRVPLFSPDGKELSYIEDRDRLMVLTLASGKTRQITDGEQCYSTAGGFNYNWSPDGKWFAMSYTGNGHEPYTDIGIVSTAGGEPIHNLTNSGYTDSSPQWVLGGDAILFTSERYGMRNHASWGTLRDVMIVFLNREAYDRFRLTKEDRELEKELIAVGFEITVRLDHNGNENVLSEICISALESSRCGNSLVSIEVRSTHYAVALIQCLIHRKVGEIVFGSLIFSGIIVTVVGVKSLHSVIKKESSVYVLISTGVKS